MRWCGGWGSSAWKLGPSCEPCAWQLDPVSRVASSFASTLAAESIFTTSMILPGRRALSPAAGVSLYSKAPLTRIRRPPAHHFAAFLAFRKTHTTRPSSNARANFQVRRVPYDAMNHLQDDGSFDSIKSATTKSPASDAGSDDFFDSSIIDAVDDLVRRLRPDTVGRHSSTSESKPSSKRGAAKAEEQTEAPYTPRFAIPSPPPPINGIRSDPPQYFTHKLYRDPEGKPVTVHYCTNFKKAEELCKPFLKEKVVGFDMEWESYASPEDTIKRNISVMQVASESTVVVFHIAQFQGGNTTKELIPPSLISLIESRDVIKTGVAVWTADGKRIQKFLGLNPRGFVELSHFFHVLQNTRTASGTYPKNLFDYAAADAYAGLALYHIMNEKRKQLRPTPPHPRFAELGLPIEGAKEDKEEAPENGPTTSNGPKVVDEEGVQAAQAANEPPKDSKPPTSEVKRARRQEEAPENGPITFNGLKAVNEEGVQSAQAANEPPKDSKLPTSEVKKARRKDDAKTISNEAEEASKNLLDFLTTPEPCLQNWTIGLTGRLTCLSRLQACELIARCGGEALVEQRKIKSATLVIHGTYVSERKLRILYENQIPTIFETDFYKMIRNRHLVKSSTAGPQTTKRRQYLENLLTELFQSVCDATGREPVPLGDTISSVCREMPKTVMDLRTIDGALFLYTVLKDCDHDLLKILH
ncbi:hypothetical protein BC567DRAFT_299444 [Phyllosticta citribraziliensis]